VGASTDNDPDFTDEFCGFLQRCVANVDAAELLLALFKNPRRSWQPHELCAQLAPIATLSEADVQRYLGIFEGNELVVRDAAQRALYRPAPEHDAYLATLSRLYVERPVTLFRVIYGLRDSKINTFADAFKLRR
jgi:hypothetical protein